MNIIEQNKVLAKFQGLNVTGIELKNYNTLIFCEENGDFDIEDINLYEPHKDWNQLMRLIDEIEGISCIIEINISCVVSCRICWLGHHDRKVRNFVNETNNMDAVYRSVVEFVESYNNQ